MPVPAGDVAIENAGATVRVNGDTTCAIYARYTGTHQGGAAVYGETDTPGDLAAGGLFYGTSHGVMAFTDPSSLDAYGVHAAAGGSYISTKAEGVLGHASCGELGIAIGVHGSASGPGSGLDAAAIWGVYGEADGGDGCLAGKFDGDVDVTESLSVGGFRMNETPVDGGTC